MPLVVKRRLQMMIKLVSGSAERSGYGQQEVITTREVA